MSMLKKFKFFLTRLLLQKVPIALITFAIIFSSLFFFTNKGWAPCGTFIGDYVWNDVNHNGVQDEGENGIEGVKLVLKSASGVVLESTYTDANGHYEFTNHCPDDYVVEVDENTLPDGYVPSPCSDNPDSGTVGNDKDSNCSPQILTLGYNEHNETIDFGYYETPQCTGTIGDVVWQDVNRDGVQSSGDSGISGVVVKLLDAQGNVLATDTTDADGHYEFTGLCAGDYEVVVDENSASLNGLDPVDPCSSDSDPSGSGNDSDSNCSPQSVTLSSDDSQNPTIDFGYTSPCSGSIGDFVWSDVDGDGSQSSGDEGIAGVTLRLLDSTGNVLATTVTDSNGHYEFVGLCAGDYEVVVDETSNALNGFEPVMPCSSDSDPSGSGNDLDSNCSPQLVTLGSDNSHNLSIDFGYVAECGPCDGKVTQLTLRYMGDCNAYIEVVQKKCGIVFSDMVAPGEEFTFSGTDKKGTLGTEIRIYVNGHLNTKIHTSCSQPIGIGMVFGDFVIVDGYSRNGGRLCPVSAGGSGSCDSDSDSDSGHCGGCGLGSCSDSDSDSDDGHWGDSDSDSDSGHCGGCDSTWKNSDHVSPHKKKKHRKFRSWHKRYSWLWIP